ncbi:MAG TPA: PDZ domain-containing protein [Phycisphaerales bacterium]|nr:PDZ domain-containing protein [Phycisphaerales bacterium]
MAARVLLTLVVTLAGTAAAAPPDAKDRAAASFAIKSSAPTDAAADAKALQAVRVLLPKLNSPSIYDRLEAHDELRRMAGTRLQVLEALLSGGEVSAEQLERISSLGYAIFAAQPRAAMGVRFGSAQGTGEGVVIDGAVPGFDAARVLLPGDVIRTIAGVAVREQMDARRIIISFDPGDELPMEISRQGQIRDVTVKLGAFTDLNNGFRVDNASLRLAWETRLARARGTVAQEALSTGLPKERHDALRLQAAVPKIYRGRGPVDATEVESTAADGPLITAAGRMRSPALTYNRPFRFRPAKGDMLSNLEMQTDQSDKWGAQARLVQAALRDPALPLAQRLRHEHHLAQNQRQLVQNAVERREAWRDIRAEIEATEEPH